MYTLPHPLDRPYQPEVLKWILESDKKYNILRAPTGFGKSPLAAATSIDFRTIALVLHKSLQSTNYRDVYEFDILYGKSNYLCEKSGRQISLPGMNIKFTAYDCSEPDCLCPYQAQVLRCQESNRVSLNYAKFLATKKFTYNYGPEILFLDEAHNLPDIVTEFVGITLNYDNEFLQCYGNVRPAQEMVLNYNEAMTIFRQLARACEQNKPKQSEDLVRWRKWKRLHTKILTTNEVLASGSLKDWHYETTDSNLIIKPLTAKYHFKKLFDVADKVVLMSATIKPTIAQRLGISEDEYDYMQVPSIWPTPTRLIYDLGAPRINYKAPGSDRDKQAELIARQLDPDHSGIIHTMSKSQSFDLKDRLEWYQDKKRQLQFYVPEIGIGTEKQLEQWYQARRPGVYCVSWSFHEGVDLGADNINVMAKTPYSGLGSNYEQAKKDYDIAWYLEKAAQTMEQLFGRHQRGIAAHYSGSKLAFIADGSWHRLKSHLSSDFRKRIRNWNGNK